MSKTPGQDVIKESGYWKAFRFLILRRTCQLGVLAMFLALPLAGLPLINGNLSSSIILGVVPMSDPLAILQSLLAGHQVAVTGLIGAAVVISLYAMLGGRSFCSWVCPINPVTDLAAWLRRKLGIRNSHKLPQSSRYWILALVLALPIITGMLVWGIFNPVTLAMRGILFGIGAGWYLIAGIFVFDLLVSYRGWCGHLCPLGTFYGLLGRLSPLQVIAVRRNDCDDCMDCYAICPEPHILPLALKGKKGYGPILKTSDCTRCGRCIDVCAKQVFQFQTSLHKQDALTSLDAASSVCQGSKLNNE